MKKYLFPLLVIVLGTVALMLFDQYINFSWADKGYYILITLVLFLLGASMNSPKKTGLRGLKMFLVLGIYVALALYYVGFLRIAALDELLSKFQFTTVSFWMVFIYLGFIFAA